MTGSSAAHTRLVSEIRAALGMEPDLALWPLRQARAVPLRGGAHPQFYGLVKGASDLLGILKPNGLLVGLEAKTGKARRSPDQISWSELVKMCGGFYATVRSVRDAKRAIELARQGVINWAGWPYITGASSPNKEN